MALGLAALAGGLSKGAGLISGFSGMFGSSGPDPKDVPYIKMRDNYFSLIRTGQIDKARAEYKRLLPLKKWKYLPTVETYARSKGINLSSYVRTNKVDNEPYYTSSSKERKDTDAPDSLGSFRVEDNQIKVLGIALGVPTFIWAVIQLVKMIKK